MARPSAAAGLLACAVLFLFAGQSAADYYFPFIITFPSIFPKSYVPPPPVRIYSKQDTRLNMAVDRYSGKVILVAATYDDPSQLWWNIPAPTSLLDGEGVKYWLVNVATGKAMTSPPVDGGMPVTLEEFNPWDGQQLWVPSPPRLQDGGFYQIKPYTQRSKALNGLWGNVHVGTVIGIYSDKPVTLNTLWVTSSAYPFY